MTISAERREELLSQLESINWPTADATKSELRTLLHDSARLERIERDVRELADKLGTSSAWPIAAAIRETVDTGRGEGGEG